MDLISLQKTPLDSPGQNRRRASLLTEVQTSHYLLDLEEPSLNSRMSSSQDTRESSSRVREENSWTRDCS